MDRYDQRPPTGANGRVRAARESFSGRLLINAQFDDATAVIGIIKREIQYSGSFKEKLSDYAHAFARSQRIDAVKAETILRDLFKEQTGQTMNAMREGLIEREKRLSDPDRDRALDAAYGTKDLVERGPLVTFRRAYAQQAETLAGELGVTDAAAKVLMKDEFKAAQRAELSDWGKDLEERFYRPQVEAEQRRREQGSGDRSERREKQSDTRQDNDAPRRRYRTGPSGP